MLSPIVLAVVGIGGLLVGTQVNRAIYAWRLGEPALVGPWGRVLVDAPPRQWTHFIPIAGWWIRRDEAELHGPRFWLRPMLIETAFALGMPAFYYFQMSGGLIESSTAGAQVRVELAWFGTQSLLIVLMTIATFIDFDEKTIPDQVTIPGTLLALFLAWIIPYSALPITEPNFTGKPTPQAASLRYDFPGFDPVAMVGTDGRFEQVIRERAAQSASQDAGRSATGLLADDIPDLMKKRESLWIALAILWIWCIALIPKTIYFRRGLFTAFELAVASMRRPPRKTKSKKKFRVPPRRMYRLTKLLLAIGVAGTILVVLAFNGPLPRWYALFSALVGMGFGGLTVWSVRIFGSMALQREAMGFGDVTLLAMIGAFLGWQPAFLAFALAPFAAILIAVGQYLATRRNELAFGPYLCLGALLLVLTWKHLWNLWAGPHVFMMGSLLLWVLGASLIMLFVILTAYRWISYR